MLYNLGDQKKNFYCEKTGFTKPRSLEGLWASVIVIFGISIVDNVRPAISSLKKRF